jgi:hypothetical protein
MERFYRGRGAGNFFEANLAGLQRAGGHVVVLKNFGAAGFVKANQLWHI